MLPVLQGGIKGVWAPRGLVGGVEWRNGRKRGQGYPSHSCNQAAADLGGGGGLAADMEKHSHPWFLWEERIPLNARFHYPRVSVFFIS